jgi:hypothetical protein
VQHRVIEANLTLFEVEEDALVARASSNRRAKKP